MSEREDIINTCYMALHKRFRNETDFPNKLIEQSGEIKNANENLLAP